VIFLISRSIAVGAATVELVEPSKPLFVRVVADGSG
jgi:hypothetical protein